MLFEEKIEIINQKVKFLREKNFDRIVVWGGGEHTEKLLCHTDMISLPIRSIVDKKSSQSVLWGYTISAPQNINWLDVDAVIISSFKYQDEIKDELISEYHFKGEIVLLYGTEEKVPFYKLQSKENAIIWKGDFETWDKAYEACRLTGFSKAYEEDEILNYSIKNIKNNMSHEKYYHLIAWLLRIATENNNCLRVLDLGGALGNVYYSIKDFFDVLDDFEWIVVEQDNYVSYGKKHLEEKSLKFCSSIDEAYEYANGMIDVALCSAVFSYLQDYYNYLKKLTDLHIANIIIDRQALSIRERITMQELTDKFLYQAAYPCRILQKEKFLNYFKDSYDCINESLCYYDGTLFFSDQIAEFYCLVFKHKEDCFS